MEVDPKEPFQPTVIPDGIYSAKIAKIELLKKDEYNLEFGDAFSIHFEVTDEGDHFGKTVKGLTSTLLTTKSKFGKWVEKLGLKFEVGQKFNTDEMLGKMCKILTELKVKRYKDGTEFEQSDVKDVFPAEKKTEQSAVDKAFEEDKMKKDAKTFM